MHKCETSIVSLPGPHATLKSSVACASHPETIDWPFYRSSIDKYFDDYYIFIFLHSVLGDRYLKNNRNINHPCINLRIIAHLFVVQMCPLAIIDARLYYQSMKLCGPIVDEVVRKDSWLA